MTTDDDKARYEAILNAYHTSRDAACIEFLKEAIGYLEQGEPLTAANLLSHVTVILRSGSGIPALKKRKK